MPPLNKVLTSLSLLGKLWEQTLHGSSTFYSSPWLFVEKWKDCHRPLPQNCLSFILILFAIHKLIKYSKSMTSLLSRFLLCSLIYLQICSHFLKTVQSRAHIILPYSFQQLIVIKHNLHYKQLQCTLKIQNTKIPFKFPGIYSILVNNKIKLLICFTLF